jgi:asparagine synthase (glutamine-hydrolysing)
MCGIFALITSGENKRFGEVLRATASLRLRGPDSTSIVHNRTGVYVFTRLAVNDTSTSGNQPFVKRYVKNGEVHDTLLMCNGEIYNHVDLERTHSLTPVSKSDCECISLLYEKMPVNELMRLLDGDFAFVLVDRNLRTGQTSVYAGRDRVGVRPLFYSFSSVGTVFSSIADPILKMGLRPRSVLPGDLMSAGDEWSIQSNELFFMSGSLMVDYPSPERTIRERLERAVQKRLLSDRPIGCLLSGGLDSSVITALLVKFLGPKNVRTYSVGMEGSTDLKYAKMVAEHLGTVHTEVLFTPEEGFAVIPEVIKRLESSDITTVRASVGMHILAEYIRAYTDDVVIFSGEGSDELFCGYLYWHNSPSVEASAQESIRLYKNLHLYDVLRADRMISSSGLELRVPFLDKDVIAFAFSCDPALKVPQNGVEKALLRRAFVDLLPAEVISRRKEAFSDGVSGTSKSWYQLIQERVDSIIPDNLFASGRYRSKEHQYYSLIFEHLFPTYTFTTPVWLPKWSTSTDPSARTLAVY